jgi:hypothetical protein
MRCFIDSNMVSIKGQADYCSIGSSTWRSIFREFAWQARPARRPSREGFLHASLKDVLEPGADSWEFLKRVPDCV